MPNCITHFLHAEQVLELLPEKAKGALYHPAFVWGAQGPDFLFCHRYFPWQKGESLSDYGTELHEHPPADTLDCLREFLHTKDESVYHSYIYGFLCHYALDSTAHPYVIAFSKELLEERPYETETTLHAEIESSLDTIMLRRETGKLPTEAKLKQYFPKDAAAQNAIAEVYSVLFDKLFKVQISKQAVLEATADAHRVFFALTDKTTMKKKIFDRIERGKPSKISSHLIPVMENEEIDYANSSKSPWTAGGESHQEDFFELFETAVQKAVTLITEFDHADFAALTQNVPFG